MKSDSICFFSELISFATTGFNALNEQARTEVKDFILSQQNIQGGFTDRGGAVDAYYSLFGFFLARASRQDEVERKLKEFIKKQDRSFKKNLINLCCLSIIEKETGNWLKKISRITRILFSFLTSANGMSNSYQYFMVFLALDAYGLNNILTRSIVRSFLRKIEYKDDGPCPVQAARLALKIKVDPYRGNELNRITDFFDSEKGFKAFVNSPEADLLSTAVALVSLKIGNYDLRAIRPTCLELLQENYRSGAFIAGNGDNERDTEYTFYGLLALGLLTK